MKKIILGVLLVILVVGFWVWREKKLPSSESLSTTIMGTTKAAVTDVIPAFDFGSVSMAKGDVERDFQITNTTDSDLIITRAETSCMCTEVILEFTDGKKEGPFGMPGHGGFSPSINVTIKPGETFIARTIFDPAAHGPAGVGRIERVVTLTSSRGPITMQFKADVTP